MRAEMAFVQGIPSVLQFRRSSPSHACICMKTKKSSKGPQKKAQKPERATAAATGFGGSQRDGNGASSSSSDRAVNVVREKTSGAEGDATPHRAAVLDVQTMEDPRKRLVPGPTSREKRVALASEIVRQLRFEWGLSADEMIEKLEDARNWAHWIPLLRRTGILFLKLFCTGLRLQSCKLRETKTGRSEKKNREICANCEGDLSQFAGKLICRSRKQFFKRKKDL